MNSTKKILIGRRGFFHWVQTSLLAMAGVLGAWGALAYLYPPGLRRRLRSPARVHGAESLPPGGSATVRIAGEPALLLKTESGYRAFSLTAVERILAAQAQPKSALDSLEAETRPHLAALVGEQPVPPRATAEYRHLLEPSHPEHETEDEDAS